MGELIDLIELGPTAETDKMRALEQQFGLPIRDIVTGRLRQHRSLRKAARGLGVTHETLRNWCDRLGVRYIVRERAS